MARRELNGLKILMMLMSNWDNKDVRDVARGSNTAIFEYRIGKHTTRSPLFDHRLGRGARRLGQQRPERGRWNVEAFAAQTEQLITGVDGATVRWGYSGQRTADAVDGISVSDVRWLHERLAAITDAQLSGALRASGATTDEAAGFTAAIRQRIDKLGAVTQAE